MIERLLEPRKPKLNISLDDYDLIQDDYNHYKTISHNEDSNIGNWNDFNKSNVKIANETDIYDPYDLPENVEKYKIATINEDELDEFLFGFVDKEPIKHKQLDNVYKFGNPTPEQFRLSNWQTEQGTSNRLNQQIMGIETNENIEDIIESQNIGDKKHDEAFKKEVDDIMTKLNNEENNVDNQMKLNKESLPEKKANKQNRRLIRRLNNLKENAKSDIEYSKENKDTMKKIMKEKASIKPVIENTIPNRKKANEIKKIEDKPIGFSDKIFSNPGNVNYEDLKAYLAEKNKSRYSS
jgi:hypothetical protein